ncbi:hypothetical protein BD560DRAFT_187938 [Blakeslea trispora]|nr:hypothetical protein BD560DRAFT_187938 [Blakeslea trispora]
MWSRSIQCLRTNRSETILMLELLEKMRKIKTISLANLPLSEPSKAHSKKDYRTKYQQAKKVIEAKNQKIFQLQLENEKLNDRINANHIETTQIQEQAEDRLKEYQMRVYKTLHHMTQIYFQRQEKLKKIAFFRISFLKSEKKYLTMRIDQFAKEQKNDREKMNQLRAKGNRLSIHFKSVKKQLLNEIHSLRKEKKEFRSLFLDLKKTIE